MGGGGRGGGGNVEYMRAKKNTYRNLVRKLKRKRSLGGSKRRGKDKF